MLKELFLEAGILNIKFLLKLVTILIYNIIIILRYGCAILL